MNSFKIDLILCTIKEDDEVIFYDLETTGLYANRCKIIEVAAVKCTITKSYDLIIKDTFYTLINPDVKISNTITKLTGICNETIKGAPCEAEAFCNIKHFFGNNIVAGHNIKTFDNTFMKALYARFGEVFKPKKSIDTLAIAQKVLPKGVINNHQLKTLGDYFNITFKEHSAVDDVDATMKIFVNLLKIGIKPVQSINLSKNKVNQEQKKITKDNSWIHIIYGKALTAKNIAISRSSFISLLENDDIFVRWIEDEKEEYQNISFTDKWGNKLGTKRIETMFNDDFTKKNLLNSFIENGKKNNTNNKALQNDHNVKLRKLMLDVPYSEKDKAKALGARWNPNKKKWYVQNQSDYPKFQQWILNNDEDECMILCDYFYVVIGTHTCFKCHDLTPVIGFGIENYFKFYQEGLYDHDPEPEYSSDEIHIASWIEPIDGKILEYLKDNFNYYKDYSKTTKTEYYANHCKNCGIIQGNYYIFSEVDSPFFIDSSESAEALKLVRIPLIEDIKVYCDEGYGSLDYLIKQHATIVDYHEKI